MKRLTEWQNGELLVKEEERLLNANGVITKDEMYKIMRHLAEKLADYEDKEEQGMLIELPCKVGTTIYIANYWWHCIDVGNICGISECDDVDCFCFKVYVDPDTYTMVEISTFGKEWFLTEAEAEEALAKMGGK